ncbi:hypothetical protein [Helicobacter sp. 11S03491-1]|uniref:hypothetical protein n=1 Tax=Helicobacter sp. 11S03491-1 TaxID=1476196 RepID=UPI000BA6FA95|nr:hypothetical protein [Helicobacter sp. 11S03491-1]PAF42178.1 hypothetical protein BKH45_04315 [Helicobacter sp. 11S03491-1]
MENKKEITGIYNTTFNEKKATPITTQSDLEIIENAIIEEVVMYVKGYHNPYRDKGLGAEHIKLHLEKDSKGYITLEELLNLGKSIRKYTKLFQEPFIDSKGAKIYEWENDKRVRFRAIVDKQKGGPQLPLSPSDDVIITFYSDRNLNERMEFKNPSVNDYYKNHLNQTHLIKSSKKPELKPEDERITKQRRR